MAFRKSDVTDTVATPVQETVAAQAVVQEAAQAVVQEAAQAAAPAVQKPASKAVAAARPVGGFQMIWEDKRDLFISAFGELPRLKVSSGGISDGDKNKLGGWIEIQLLSYNDNFVVGPNDNNAPKELTKYSLNNEDFGDGTDLTVSQYIADLKAAGYDKAASKKYYEVVALLRDSATPSKHAGKMVQIQMSPTSVTALEGYKKQTSFALAMGTFRGDPELLRLEAEVVTTASFEWTKFSPSPSQIEA